VEWSILFSGAKVLIHLALVGTLTVSLMSDLGAQSKARPAVKPGSGASFRDCPNCPELAAIGLLAVIAMAIQNAKAL